MIKTSNYGNYLNRPPLTRGKKTKNIRYRFIRYMRYMQDITL